jgi:hypothetical protein
LVRDVLAVAFLDEMEICYELPGQEEFPRVYIGLKFPPFLRSVVFNPLNSGGAVLAGLTRIDLR